jgi:hypothetical protein
MGRTLLAACLGLLAVLTAVPLSSAEVCTKAQGCMFWDDQYHEYILYDVDTAKVDVLIVPPVSPLALSDLAAIEQSVQAWEDGIDALAPAWLADGLNIQHYTIGVDVPPQDALADPEIIIWTANHDPFVLFGIGEQVPFSVCREQSDAAHLHPEFDWVLQRTGCEDGGLQCHVINTSWLLGTAHDMYDLNAHEFGHCLGLGHVGDALDFSAKTVPLTDIMSYATTPSQVHCVSTLNIQGLEGIYANLLGQPGQVSAGDYITMNPGNYSQTTCANPSEDLFGGASLAVEPTHALEDDALQGLPLLGSADVQVATWDPVRILGFAGL